MVSQTPMHAFGIYSVMETGPHYSQFSAGSRPISGFRGHGKVHSGSSLFETASPPAHVPLAPWLAPATAGVGFTVQNLIALKKAS